MTRVVIGLGFRAAAPQASIAEVIDAARNVAAPARPTLLATPADKSSYPPLIAAAEAAALPCLAIDEPALQQAAARITTHSARVARARGVGSVCEAAALAAAGPTARLAVSRFVSRDRQATAAVAIEETH
ncbi:cobalamin biosynthesis protein [Rhodopseudomonas palustris]|uniref:Cobalamin biosynthesis protein CbiG n=1 Tax=Rhodopseudomonas palustris TaxID=1076 RepID=A0A418UYP6_RHOPL|nr:cobalamin biosynthesis protein [Rhodopseudomonas palustris]RJF68316.1 cobalamin biosynthesis protein CbiG [Rhodopseudomonas palustris]